MKRFLQSLIIVVIAISLITTTVHAANNIFQNGGNVGVGTTSPTGMFSIQPFPQATSSAIPASLLQVANQQAAGGNTLFTVQNNSNVGIGTTSPGVTLSVVGGILTTASSTFQNGVNLQAGCYAVSGVCIGGLSTVANGGTGVTTFPQGWVYSLGGIGALSASTSPTINYFTATSTTATSTINTGGFSVASNALLVQQGSNNVGIGTTSPFAILSVNAATGLPEFFIGSSTATNFSINKSGYTGLGISNATDRLEVYGNFTLDNAGTVLSDNSRFSMKIAPDDLNTAVTAEYIYPTDGGNHRLYIGTAAAHVYTLNLAYLTAGIEGLATIDLSTANPANALTIQGQSTIARNGSPTDLDYNASTFWQNVYFHSGGGGTTLTMSSANNVGIGSTSPYAPLSLGSTNMTSSPWVAIGSGSNSSNQAISVSGGRSIIGFDSVAGNTVLQSGTSKGLAVYVNGTNQSFLTGTQAFTILSTGLTGIGTTTPLSELEINSGASTGNAFLIATSSGATIFGIDNDGHRFTSGPTPNITNGTDVGDDMGGTITTNAAVSSVTLTFAKAYKKTPYCKVTDDSLTISADISAISTTAVTFSLSAPITTGHLYYECAYHQ